MKKQCDQNKPSVSVRTNTDKTDGSALSVLENVTLADAWVCDSGASHHITYSKQYFSTYEKFSVPVDVLVANETKISAFGSGRVNVEAFVDGKWTKPTWTMCGTFQNLEDICFRCVVRQNKEIGCV